MPDYTGHCGKTASATLCFSRANHVPNSSSAVQLLSHQTPDILVSCIEQYIRQGVAPQQPVQRSACTCGALLLCEWLQHNTVLLQGQRKLHVGFCLKLLEMCFKHVLAQEEQSDLPALAAPEAAIQRLVQLQSFARGMAPTAAGLDIKPFLAHYLPAQLLLLVITSTGRQASSRDEDVDTDKDLTAEEAAAALADLRLAAVEELCLHCNSSNVQEVADLIEELPSPTVLDTTSTPSVHSTAEVPPEFELSSSTAYTAAACATLLEMAGLQQGENQTEACQEAADYLQPLTALHLQKLLLWCGLEQDHPLLPSGPQLPEQLPADVRLTLLQTGSQLLLRHAEAGVEFERDGRLELEANRLDALCAIQQSCDLTPEQWDMVERALEVITAAAGEGSSEGTAAVKACVGELVSSGLAMQDVLSAAESLQGLVAVVDEEEQSKSQAAVVISAVVQQHMTDTLAALPSTSGQSSGSVLMSEHATSSDQEGHSLQHMDCVAQQEGNSFASADEAVGVILGVLQSLQSAGTSAEAYSLVTDLRQHVWTALQHHLFSQQDLSESSDLEPEQLQLLEAVLTLSGRESTSSVASPEERDKLPVIHWQDWTPEDSSSWGLGQQMLLVSRSRAVVSALWPEAPLTSQDLANHSAAQELFLRLLERADEVQQLHGLQGLLEHIWQSGDAVPSDQADQVRKRVCILFWAEEGKDKQTMPSFMQLMTWSHKPTR